MRYFRIKHEYEIEVENYTQAAHIAENLDTEIRQIDNLIPDSSAWTTEEIKVIQKEVT